MVVKEVILHMNAGNDETSYANNSLHQKMGISKSWHIVDETLKDMFTNGSNFPTTCIRMADLGCSSGPNTLFLVSHIIEKIVDLCKNVSEFEVFLNDLPENDFNNVFKMLPSFRKKLDYDHEKRIKCFVSGLPGSFYGRLFPSKSMNFIYSSYSLQWLSKVPQGLENNRNNILMSISSPPDVHKAYVMQYEIDFSTFLSSRGEEMLPGGRMVLTIVGRSVEDPSTKDDSPHLTLLASTLVDMAAEGLIKECDLHSFNMAIYTPCKQEVDSVIHSEGSFYLDKIEDFVLPSNALENCKYKIAKVVANSTRAFSESVLKSHFGSSIVDELFIRFEIKVAKHLSSEELTHVIIVACLTKR